jgi:hypothetical protein
MLRIKLKSTAAVLAASAAMAGTSWFVQQAPAHKPEPGGGEKNPPAVAVAPAGKADRASKLDLTPETFAAFRDLIRPADNEWRHLKVKWLTDIVAARKKAAQEDKPILIFRTGGAGYNDPMGVC